MNKFWRLILDDKADGSFNMAKDEALASNYLKDKIPSLRVYGWDKPFITIGYNQKPQEVIQENSQLPFIKRITGGASIIHDQEITYSLVCSVEDLNLPTRVKESYKVLTSFLLDFYSSLGLRANFAQDIAKDKITRCENFCFSSYEPYDIIINGKKIGGNAQRRKKDVIFQHGSIPQFLNFLQIESEIRNTENLAYKTTYLEELLKIKTDFLQLRDLLKDSFARTFALKFK